MEEFLSFFLASCLSAHLSGSMLLILYRCHFSGFLASQRNAWFSLSFASLLVRNYLVFVYQLISLALALLSFLLFASL